MVTDHTQERLYSIAGISIATALLALLIGGDSGHSVYAQAGTTRRLSSDPNDLRDAFVRHPENIVTPQQFARFLQGNKTLLRQYARHFKVPEDKVVAFVQHALVPYRLKTPETVTTFGITKQGRIYPVSTHLPAGSKVWATREGIPVLKWNCSNPLSYRLPGTRLAPPLETAYIPSPVTPVFRSSSPSIPASLDSVETTSLPFSNDSVVTTPPMPPESVASVIPPPVLTSTSASLPVTRAIGNPSGNPLSDLWPALVVPLFFIHPGGSSAPPVPVQDVAPSAVSETSTIVLLLTALPLFGGGFLFARRKKGVPERLDFGEGVVVVK